MDRRTVTAVILSLTFYYTWLLMVGPPVEPLPEEQPEVETPQQVVPAPVAATDAPISQEAFEACGMQALMTTDGGGIGQVVLPEEEGPYEIVPLYSYVLGLFSGGPGKWHPYPQETVPEQILSDDALALAAGTGNPADARQRFRVEQASSDRIEVIGVDDNGIEIRSVLSKGQVDPCLVDLTVTWTHTGGPAYDGPLWVGMHEHVPAPGWLDIYRNMARVLSHVDGDVEYGMWTEPEPGKTHEPELIEGPTFWFGIADRYFGVLAMPEDTTRQSYWSVRPDSPDEDGDGQPERGLRGVHWVAGEGLQPGQSHDARMQVYVGQLDTDRLAAVDPVLVDVVDFGIVAVFAYPLLFALRFLQGVLGNWGVAIIALTLAVKLAFFPLTQKAFRSGEAMKAIQPLMNEVKEKYKDDPQKQQQATIDLFREHNVNPAGGCLPMLVQMPVFFALFYVLMYSADLYHTEFLYLKDLSSPDPYMVLPTVVVGLMVLQQQFTPMGNMDPAQARMMKMMPLMFGIFWYMFPSGLVVYYFVNTALSILQQWWIRRTFGSAQGQPDTAAAAP